MDDAEELFLQAVELDPWLAIAYTNLGNIRFRRGDEDEAERLYQKALSLDTTQPEAQYNLGYVMLERGRPAEAIAFFKAFPDQHLDNRPYKVLIAGGDWTCSVAHFTGTMTGPMQPVSADRVPLSSAAVASFHSELERTATCRASSRVRTAPCLVADRPHPVTFSRLNHHDHSGAQRHGTGQLHGL
jgi:tetratricopeptide (TPR) repeat protein